MKISLAFLRVFFVLLSLFFMTAFMISLPVGSVWQKVLIGLGVGFLFSTLLLSLEVLFKRYNLKAFNTVTLGLFLGYLMGQALNSLFGAVLDLSHMRAALQPQTIDLLRVSFFLLGTYMGTFLTIHFSDEILLSFPFIKLNQSKSSKKDLLVDSTALSDSRILDLASTGLIDNALVMPRLVLKELYSQAEMGDEATKTKAKRCLETVKKLEAIPNLGLRFDETQYSDSSDSFTQLLRLARIGDSNILTADISQAQIPAVEGIKIVNLHGLSNALKPLMQSGESMKIKIQRYGKEPNQGVGYLEDGTMVVVNGGGDYIGENIDVTVLSVKHTSSGRMIFCNTLDDIPSKGNRVEV
ncbi:MAG: putative PIN and TRAM-domain containing protein YacL [Chlamydiae bacterium]|nr:putative PIN and TRAM-domain containing protein YacL [Chlamydiota bacterium]